MKSQNVIMVACWIALILDWTTDVLPHPDLASAMIWAWLIMWLFGFFKREEANAGAHIRDNGSIEDGLSDRQKDFIEKMRRGKEEGYQPETENLATIKTIDEDGTVSTISIKPDGRVEVDGHPDPDIVEAAEMLSDSVLEHGPEAIAEEINKQIEKMNAGEK